MRPSNWPVFRRFLPLLMLGLFAHAAAYGANDWVSTATYKPGSTLLNNRLCYTDGTDISCDGAAGLLLTSGTLAITNVSATGNISANKFVGDGSLLTNINAAAISDLSADRIVSGTTSMLAVSTTGYISVTQSGQNTAWFDPTLGLVTLGVSTTGPISGTTGYFNNVVGIGRTAASNYMLSISGTSIASPTISFSNGTYTGYLGFLGSTYYMVNQSSAPIILGTNNTSRLLIDATGRTGIGTNIPSTTLHISGTTLTTSWTGINFSGTNTVPTAPLEVSGTISATAFQSRGNLTVSGTAYVSDLVISGISTTAGVDPSFTSSANWYGLASIPTAVQNISNGTIASTTTVNGQYASFTTLYVGGVAVGGGGGSSGDRITSSTTSMVANPSGYISITTSGVATGYIRPTGELVTTGVSTTGPISTTMLYVSGIAATAGVEPYATPNWYGITDIPAQVQNVSNGTVISTTAANGLYASYTNLLSGNISTTSLFISGIAAASGLDPSISPSWYALTDIPAQVQNVSNGLLISTTTANAQYASFTTLTVGSALIAGTISTSGNISTSSIYIAGLAAPSGIDSFVSGDWYSITNMPAQVQNVSNGLLISTTAVYGQYASFTTLLAGTATVSGSLKLSGSGSEACTTAANKGTLRINPTTNRLQVCR